MAWSETKRRSVQAYTMGLMRPVATGTIGVLARATVAWLFAADSWPSSGGTAILDFRLLFWLRRGRR
jgi:hypothetical protein